MLFLGEMHIIVCWTGSPNIPLLVPHCHRSLVWLPTKHVPCCPSVPSQLSWSSITSPLHTGFERAQQQCLLLIYQCTEEQHYSTFVRFHRLVRLWLQRQFFFLVFPSFSSRFNFSCCLFLPGGLKPAPKHTPHKRDHDRERRQICHPALLPSCSSHLNPAFPRIPWSLPAGTRAEKAESHHFPQQLVVIPCATAIPFGVSNQVQLDGWRATENVYLEKQPQNSRVSVFVTPSY